MFLQARQVFTTYRHPGHERRDVPQFLGSECNGMQSLVVGGVLFQRGEEVVKIATNVTAVAAGKAVLEGLLEDRKREIDSSHNVYILLGAQLGLLPVTSRFYQ